MTRSTLSFFDWMDEVKSELERLGYDGIVPQAKLGPYYEEGMDHTDAATLVVEGEL